MACRTGGLTGGRVAIRFLGCGFARGAARLAGARRVRCMRCGVAAGGVRTRRLVRDRPLDFGMVGNFGWVR